MSWYDSPSGQLRFSSEEKAGEGFLAILEILHFCYKSPARSFSVHKLETLPHAQWGSESKVHAVSKSPQTTPRVHSGLTPEVWPISPAPQLCFWGGTRQLSHRTSEVAPRPCVTVSKPPAALGGHRAAPRAGSSWGSVTATGLGGSSALGSSALQGLHPTGWGWAGFIGLHRIGMN